MKALRFLAILLMIIGSLNWGLIGFFGYDLISNLFGGMMMMGARIIYALVGLAGLFSIGLFARCFGCNCKCGPNCGCCTKKE